MKAIKQYEALRQENERLKAELEGKPVLQTEWEKLMMAALVDAEVALALQQKRSSGKP